MPALAELRDWYVKHPIGGRWSVNDITVEVDAIRVRVEMPATTSEAFTLG